MDRNNIERIKKGSVSVIGYPFDQNYSYLPGAGEGPVHIFDALHSDSSNMATETRLDLALEERFIECGNMAVSTYFELESLTRSVLARETRPIFLGGEHSITYPIIKAFAPLYPDLTVIHLDAHPDLYHDFEGNPYAHGCPFARIMEEGLVHRLIQIGIRTANPHQKEQADRFGVETIDMRQLQRQLPLFKIDHPVYISLDLDVLDPAFAPGLSHYEPGGMSVREVISVLQGIEARVVGADIVELNPTRDLNGMTAMVAAKFIKEIADKMLGTQNG
jgi:agmatinase